MKFELDKEQVKKFKKWQKSFEPLPYIGSTGGHFGIKIILTSIGEVIYGYNWKGDEVDLTDYSSL